MTAGGVPTGLIGGQSPGLSPTGLDIRMPIGLVSRQIPGLSPTVYPTGLDIRMAGAAAVLAVNFR